MLTVCLQHVPFEGPGVFETHLVKRGVRVERHLVSSDGLPRDPGDLLIVMGGPMSVNDADAWIVEETAFVKRALESGMPVLGVCLGSQFMAKALGANVGPGVAIEVGMTPIRMTEEGRSDPVFAGVPQTFEVFQWHGEVFNLPAGSVPLASSDLCPVQAFRVGTNAYGMLFHLELEESGVESLCREFPQDVAQAGLTPDVVLHGAGAHLANLHGLAERLIDHLVRSAAHFARSRADS